MRVCVLARPFAVPVSNSADHTHTHTHLEVVKYHIMNLGSHLHACRAAATDDERQQPPPLLLWRLCRRVRGGHVAVRVQGGREAAVAAAAVVVAAAATAAVTAATSAVCFDSAVRQPRTYGSAARSKHSLMRRRNALASSIDLKNWQCSATPEMPNVLLTLPTCNAWVHRMCLWQEECACVPLPYYHKVQPAQQLPVCWYGAWMHSSSSSSSTAAAGEQ